MRLAPLSGGLIGTLLDFSGSSDTQKHQLGSIIDCVGTDFLTTANVANWGACEVMYVRNDSTAILPGIVCHWDKNFSVTATAAAASELGTGQPVCVALSNFSLGSTTPQYGWVLISGIAPVQYSVAATTGLVFMGTAGKLTPTQGAGIQLLNARCLIAAVSTFTRTGQTQNGKSFVSLPNVAGVYVGQAISGTGIPASSVVSSIDPSGQGVYIGSAVGTLVTATASGSVTVTFTNTGFGIVQMQRSGVQGQIL